MKNSIGFRTTGLKECCILFTSIDQLQEKGQKKPANNDELVKSLLTCHCEERSDEAIS